MNVAKYKSNEVLYKIRHNLRELPKNQNHSNEDIVPELSSNNYSLLTDRPQDAESVNQYRKDIEKGISIFNRKNLIHAVEIVVQCPDSCPPEEHYDFFKTTLDYVASKLPRGKQDIIVAQVHRDEQKKDKTGRIISKEHVHIMFVPVVPVKKQKKRNGFDYKLCADQLTKKTFFTNFHPELQKRLTDSGIHATIYNPQKKSKDIIPLTASQLKQLTNQTGLVLDHSLSINELAQILNQNVTYGKLNQELEAKLLDAQKRNIELQESIKSISFQNNIGDAWNGSNSWYHDHEFEEGSW